MLFFVRTIIFANYPKCTLYSMLKVTSISSILSKAQLIHMKGSHFPLFFSKKDSTKVCFCMLAIICSYAFMLVSMRLYFKYKTIFPDQTRLFPMPSMPGTHWVYNISRPLFFVQFSNLLALTCSHGQLVDMRGVRGWPRLAASLFLPIVTFNFSSTFAREKVTLFL